MEYPQRQTIFLAIFLPILLLVIGGALLQQGILRNIQSGGQQEVGWLASSAWVISLLCPLPFGLWLGLKWHGRHPTAYVLIGLFVGLIGMFAYRIMIGITILPVIGRPPDAVDWLWWFTQYTLLSTFLYAVGGLVGDSLAGRIREEWITPLIGLAAAVITALGSTIAALSA